MFQYTNRNGKTYYLCSKAVTLKNGTQTVTYFFASSTEGRTPCALPVGREVVETKTGLPVLKKAE